MRIFILSFLLVVTLTACSTSPRSQVPTTKDSYPSTIAWDDALYGVSAVEVPSTNIGKEIGEIKNIVIPMPKNNGDSNDKLGKLYEIKGKESNDDLALGANGSYVEAHKLDPIISEEFHPTSLTIERNGKLQQVKHQPPAQYHVDDEQLTEKIYDTLLALQPVPNGVIYNCPIDFGISYDMNFYENGKKVLFANANGGGCQFIHLQGKDAYRSNDSFWKLMQEATGMNADQLWGSPGSF